MEASVSDHAPATKLHPRRRKLVTFLIIASLCALLLIFDAGTGQLGLFSLFSSSGPTLQISSPICGTWELKPAPFSGVMSEMELSDMAASPSGDIWVVGNATNSLGEGYHPAMSQWE